jgi:group II intron reverse transcriptase/maturase
MVISHKKIQKNDGAGTPGSNNESVEGFSYEKLKKLETSLIKKTFKWSPIKQILIPRKNKTARPIGISNYSEKIIQNNILMILEAIYEPIFEKLNISFGFRAHKGCLDAIEQLKDYKNQGLNWAIEGDIKAAFDNIHIPTLCNFLKEYINDKEFIQLIYESCITPIITKNGKIIPSNIGTPQGSIISPILFNIYMHEFDKKIINELEDTVKKYPAINPTHDPRTKQYEKTTYQKDRLQKILKKYDNIKLYRNLTNSEKIEITKIKIKINRIINRRKTMVRYDYKRIEIRYAYNRYADDFIILINRSYTICKIIRNNISNIAKKQFHLELNIEKTKITQLKTEHAKYLGFYLFMQNRETVKRINTNIRTRAGRHILVGPNLQKIFDRLVDEGYAEKDTLNPICKKSLSTLDTQEIINKYNSMMMGIFNYYYPVITYKSQLGRIYYILIYSCLKTLAKKFDTTTSKIFQKFGWQEYNLYNNPTNRTRIVYYYETLNSNLQKQEKYNILLNYRDLNHRAKIILNKRTEALIKKGKERKVKKINSNLPISTLASILTNKDKETDISQQEQLEFEDIWTKYKINWRTTFKLTKFCNICLSTEDLETHHIKKISGPTINKKDTFTQTIMKNFNRKQLILCRLCHNKLHNGQLNISKKDILDKRTILIENYLKSENTKYAELESQNTYRREYYTFCKLSRTVINHCEESQYIAPPYKPKYYNPNKNEIPPFIKEI